MPDDATFPAGVARRANGRSFTVFAEPMARINDCSLFGDVYVGFASYINSGMIRSNSEIGRYCSLGRSVTVGLAHHDSSSITTSPFFELPHTRSSVRLASRKPVRRVIIGHDCWIGDSVQITSGVRVGNGSVIGASAVVTKDVEPFSVMGGIPAKLIRYRFDDDTMSRVDKIQWWRFHPSELKSLVTNDIKETLDRLEDALPNMTDWPTCYERVAEAQPQ